jgi:hypothetical protein
MVSGGESKTELRSIGDRVVPGQYALHSAFERVINFRNRINGALASLVTPDVGPGPSSIVVDSIDEFDLNTGTFEIEPDSLTVGAQSFSLETIPRYDSTIARGTLTIPDTLSHMVTTLETILTEEAPARSVAFLLAPEREKYFESQFERKLLLRFKQAIAILKNGQIEDGLNNIRGLGYGLTPSGDDFIAGYFLACHALGIDPPAFDISGSTLSATFLEQAHKGFVNANWKAFFETISSTDFGRQKYSIRAILALGETSGADMLTGFVIGLITMRQI